MSALTTRCSPASACSIPARGLDQPRRPAGPRRRASPISAPASAGRTARTSIDGDGAVLCPGLVDMRAALGEPGFEYRETIASAAEAAAAGGITTLAALPDTLAGDRRSGPGASAARARRGDRQPHHPALWRGHHAAAAARNWPNSACCARPARSPSPTAPAPSRSARLMRLALSYARGFGARIVQHPEEPSLAAGGAATEGELATRLGLPGIPAAAEAIQVARDIRLARTDRRRGAFRPCLHRRGAGADPRAPRQDGLAVTCDTAPPYFDLNETAIGDFRTYAKLSPPLRSGGRPAGGGRGAGRRHDRRRSPPTTSRATPTTSACRSPRPRRAAPGWPRCWRDAGAGAQRHADAAAGDRAADRAAGAPAGRRRPAGWPRARRPISACSTRSGSGRSRPASCPARRRTRRSTAARWKGACSAPGRPGGGCSAADAMAHPGPAGAGCRHRLPARARSRSACC